MDWIVIGRITAPHGIRGEVRILPLTDYPERFLDMKELRLLRDGERRMWGVEHVRPHNRLFIAKLTGVQDMDQAEQLRNASIEVTPDELITPPPGSFFIFQLIGLDVLTTERQAIGVITDVITTGANDVYVVKPKGRGRDILIPAIQDVVKTIDPDRGIVLIDPIPGLLDDGDRA